MTNHAHYVSNVESEVVEGVGNIYTVSLQIWSEDGRDEYQRIGNITTEKAARDLAAFWATGGHAMVMTIIDGVLPQTGDQYEDYPDPTDIEEMKYC